MLHNLCTLPNLGLIVNKKLLFNVISITHLNYLPYSSSLPSPSFLYLYFLVLVLPALLTPLPLLPSNPSPSPPLIF